MKPENALPAYLYCKLESTFQTRGKNTGRTAPPGKAGERVEKPENQHLCKTSLELENINRDTQQQQTTLNTNEVQAEGKTYFKNKEDGVQLLPLRFVP